MGGSLLPSAEGDARIHDGEQQIGEQNADQGQHRAHGKQRQHGRIIPRQHRLETQAAPNPEWKRWFQ